MFCKRRLLWVSDVFLCLRLQPWIPCRNLFPANKILTLVQVKTYWYCTRTTSCQPRIFIYFFICFNRHCKLNNRIKLGKQLTLNDEGGFWIKFWFMKFRISIIIQWQASRTCPFHISLVHISFKNGSFPFKKWNYMYIYIHTFLVARQFYLSLGDMSMMEI